MPKTVPCVATSEPKTLIEWWRTAIISIHQHWLGLASYGDTLLCIFQSRHHSILGFSTIIFHHHHRRPSLGHLACQGHREITISFTQSDTNQLVVILLYSLQYLISSPKMLSNSMRMNLVVCVGRKWCVPKSVFNIWVFFFILFADTNKRHAPFQYENLIFWLCSFWLCVAVPSAVTTEALCIYSNIVCLFGCVNIGISYVTHKTVLADKIGYFLIEYFCGWMETAIFWEFNIHRQPHLIIFAPLALFYYYFFFVWHFMNFIHHKHW